MKKYKIIAMIPARIGSQRLKFKNFALIKNKPLISYAINAAKNSKIFSNVIINSDSKLFKKIADELKCDFFLRKKKLGSSNTKSDDVVNDFLSNYDCDILMWINPIAPMLDFNDIKKIKNYFIKKKLNSLITTHKIKVHALNGISSNTIKPINFKLNSKFKKTQDLQPIILMNYCIMMWNAKSFLESMKKTKSAILHGKIGYYNLEPYKSFIIKDKRDLNLIDGLIGRDLNKRVKYYSKIRV